MRITGETIELKPVQKTEDLLAAYCRTGSAADFEKIVRRFAPVVFTECRRVTRNADDAEDAAQLTFLALAMELKVGKTINYPSAWLQRVAKHQAIKIVRSRGRRQKREDAVRKINLSMPDETLLDAEHNSGVIRDEIDQLSDRYRLPLVLHYFGGMSLESIARELKIGKQTVGTRLHRARKMLAKKLSAHGIQLDAPLLATTLGAFVPAAVIGAIVQAASFPVKAAAPAGFQAMISRVIEATAFVAMQKWARTAAIAVATIGAGSAIGGIAIPSLSKIPNLRGGQIVEWFQQWIPSGFKPTFAPKFSRQFSQNTTAEDLADASVQLASFDQGVSTFAALETMNGGAGRLPATPVLPAESAWTLSDANVASYGGLFLRSGLQSLSLCASLDYAGFTPMDESSLASLQASPVPEPAAGVLALATAGLLRRRRPSDR